MKSKKILTNNTQGSQIRLESDSQQHDRMLPNVKIRRLKICKLMMAKTIGATQVQFNKLKM